MVRISSIASAYSISKILLSLLTILIVLVPCSSALVVDASNNWNETYNISGGRTLLVEELSTTWCENCAEIDPYLMDAADAHGSRIAIITYHPNDGLDAFEPEASQNRIDRLKLTHPDIGSTPSFIVDGGALRIGSESWPDVQKDILTKEVNNPNPSDLGFTVEKVGDKILARVNSFDAKNNGQNISQLTFILAQHGLEVPEGNINPGDQIRDRVVTGVAECNLQNQTITYSTGFAGVENIDNSCETGFQVALNDTGGQFSILLIHEKVSSNISSQDSGSQTYGVVEFAYRDYEISDPWNNQIMILLGFTIVGFLWFSYEKRR